MGIVFENTSWFRKSLIRCLSIFGMWATENTVQSCPALDVMVWEVPNIIILVSILTLFIMVWKVPNIIILEIIMT